MKRLIIAAMLTVASLVALSSAVLAATTRYTSTTIFQPAATTNHNLNIAFQVFSSETTDDQFGVQLFENNALKATQEIVHPNGNSGVFTVTLPASGTYSYFVRSINHDNANAAQDSKTVSVQITNAPVPTVFTVANGSGTAATTTSETNDATAANSNTAAAVTAGGQVTEGAAKTNREKEIAAAVAAAAVLAAKDSNANGVPDDQEKSETKDDQNSSTDTEQWVLVGITALAVGGGIAYYISRVRPRE